MLATAPPPPTSQSSLPFLMSQEADQEAALDGLFQLDVAVGKHPPPKEIRKKGGLWSQDSFFFFGTGD